MHVVLKMVEVVTHEVRDDTILVLQLVLQILITTLQGSELLLEGLNPSKLLSLYDHRIICTFNQPLTGHPPLSGTDRYQ